VVVTTRVPTAGGLPAAEVAAAVTAAGGVAETAADAAEALERLDALAGDDDLVAVVGSAVLVGEARSLLVVDDDLQSESTNGEK
jgi:folylpolyglutamate synthase/dihydropteroate synthase